jgi:putative ABC transport system permease protein
MPATELQVRPRTATLSLAVGTALTVASAIVPALWAGRVPPIAAILGLSSAPARVRRRRSIVAGAVAAVGVTLIAVGLRSEPESALRLVGLGALVSFLGVAGLARHLVRPIVAMFRPATAVLGVPGRIGRDNAARNPQRTASTAAALMIGLALVVFTSVFAASAKASLASAMDVGQRANYLVTSEGWTPFSPHLTASLAQRPEFSTVTGLRAGQAHLGAKQVQLNAVDPRGLDQLLELDLVAGGLEGTGLVVHRDVARSNGWSVGDRVTMRFPRTGDQQLAITGIFAEKRLLGVDYLLPLAEYERHYVEQLDALALVRVAPGVSPDAVSAAFASVLRDYPQLTPKTKDEVRAEQARQLDEALALVTAMLGLALLIAFLGIMNTLALTVYERTREIGLVRAIGMSRRQVRRSVRFEAVLVALIGALLGVAVGVAGGGALVSVLHDKGLSVLSVPAGQLAGYVVLAAGAGVLAAAWPARRAARLDVLAAIAHE